MDLPRSADTSLGRLDMSLRRDLPEPRFLHLSRMTDHRGLWEHSRYTTPRFEHGYCTDDNARALIVIARQPDPSPQLIAMARIYLNFIRDAQRPDGHFINRRSSSGAWSTHVGSDDSQGRALWAAGTAARRGPEPWMRSAGSQIFEKCNFRSPSPRAHAFAMLGAGEVLEVLPEHGHAQGLLEQGVSRLIMRNDPHWPWPEERLAYDNARIPEALLVAGSILSNEALVAAGITLLEWLVSAEAPRGHFSFTPAGGWTRGEPRPGFDQQPVEAAAMADACMRAWHLTGDQRWRDYVGRVAEWFIGANDRRARLYDPLTGGCGDGLMPDGINQNQGAESTLAALAVLQHAATLR